MTHISSTIAAAPGTDRTAGEIQAPLTFIRRQSKKPAFHSAALTGGEARYLYETEAHTVPVADMRPIADTLSVDREGFELLRAPTAIADLYDDAAVDGQYRAEIEALLTHRFGAARVAVFDVTRRSDGGSGAANRDGRRGPATQVHVDYTAGSGPHRARDILGAAAVDRLEAAGTRILQVNVWRPIRGPVERSPLALADASTVAADDLIATDQVFPDRVGEIYTLAHDGDQRWYYAPHMTPDEVLLIKGWDSLDDGRARFTPHSAVTVPGTRADAPARESIEVRTFVVIA